VLIPNIECGSDCHIDANTQLDRFCRRNYEEENVYNEMLFPYFSCFHFSKYCQIISKFASKVAVLNIHAYTYSVSNR
jgi:hypothetical protein